LQRTRYRKFESISLQRRVDCEPDFFDFAAVFSAAWRPADKSTPAPPVAGVAGDGERGGARDPDPAACHETAAMLNLTHI
jgi:hypothetical protein